MTLLSRREEQVLLSIFSLGEDAYLLAIRDYLSKATNKDWSVGIIHKPLLQLERKKYIESYMSGATAKRGGRRKKIYRITKAGTEALNEHKEESDILWEGFLKTADNGIKQ